MAATVLSRHLFGRNRPFPCRDRIELLISAPCRGAISAATPRFPAATGLNFSSQRPVAALFRSEPLLPPPRQDSARGATILSGTMAEEIVNG